MSIRFNKYLTLEALRSGKTLDVEGYPVAMIEGDIQVGDFYVAERNVGPKLFTAKKIVHENNLVGGYIIPNERGYAYDRFECVRVRLAE